MNLSTLDTSDLIYQPISREIHNAIDTMASGAVGGTISMVTATIVFMVTLYYVLLGYQMVAGRVQAPAGQFVYASCKFLLIAAVALNATTYNQWIVESFHDLESGISTAWAGSGGGTPLTPAAILDGCVRHTFGQAMNVFDLVKGFGWRDLANVIIYFCVGVLMVIASLIVTLPAALMIISAEIILALLLGIGPLFVVALMFPVISRWFDAWFGMVMTQIFTIAFMAMIATAMVRIFLGFTENFEPAKDMPTEDLLLTPFKIVAAAACLLWLMNRLGTIAAALAGGVSSSAITFGSMAAGAAGAAAGVAGAAKGVSNAVKGGKTTRFDPKTGKDVTATRWGSGGHREMGRVNSNPAYKAAMKEYKEQNSYKSEGGSTKET
jgi:type IV secretion system protein VirB6